MDGGRSRPLSRNMLHSEEKRSSRSPISRAGLSQRSTKISKHSTNDTNRREALNDSKEADGFRSQEHQGIKKDCYFDSPMTIITKSTNVRSVRRDPFVD